MFYTISRAIIVPNFLTVNLSPVTLTMRRTRGYVVGLIKRIRTDKVTWHVTDFTHVVELSMSLKGRGNKWGHNF